MSDFQQIEKLIRLKKFERPPEDFVEEFLTRFHERQRAELLRQSARGLLLERLDAYFHDLIMPKWTFAAATAAVALLAGWGALQMVNHRSAVDASAAYALQAELSGASLLVNASPPAPTFGVDSELIKKVTSSDQVPIESVVLLSRHFETDGLQMEVFNLPGVSRDMMASPIEFLPVRSTSR